MLESRRDGRRDAHRLSRPDDPHLLEGDDGGGCLEVGVVVDRREPVRGGQDREGVSMQVVALKAIDEYVDRRMQRRDEIIEQIFTEDAELFRRLADS